MVLALARLFRHSHTPLAQQRSTLQLAVLLAYYFVLMISVVMQLQENRRKLFRVRDLEQFSDIAQHIRQLLVAIHSNTQTITSIQNAYSTIANNVLNQRMKLLTTITILLAIPNVFYGMYGMNLALPFQHEPWAYFGIIGMSMLLILLVYLLAKRFRLF